jgi:hypothetical protein
MFPVVKQKMGRRVRLFQTILVSTVLASLLLTLTTSPAMAAGNDTEVDELELAATFECISVYSNFSDDDNGNNQATLEYREVDGTWKQGMALSVDRRQTIYDRLLGGNVSNPYRNQWRGSILGLTPNTEYEVRVTFTDPDGVTGTNPVVSTIRTRNDNFTLGSGNSYYVATDGNDLNPGTEAQPFRTIQHAADTVTAGDTVYIKAGTYQEQITITASGTADNSITFQNYGSDEVIINGGNANNVILLDGADYIRFRGLEARNGARHIFKLANEANYNVIEECTILDFGYTVPDAGVGIVTESHDNVIQNNYISSARNGYSDERHREAGITLNFWNGDTNRGPGAGTIIRYNTIEGVNGGLGDGVGGDENDDIQNGLYKDADCYGNTMINTNSDGVESEGGNINVRIWGNTMIDWGTSNVAFAPCKIGPLYVFRNVGYRSKELSLKVGWERDYGGHAYIYNNTFVTNDPAVDSYGVADWGGEGGISNQVYRNNIFMCSRWPIMLQYSPVHNMDFDYNNLWNGGRWAEFIVFNRSGYDSLAAFSSATGNETHGISANPLFVDLDNGDLRLQDTSPCIDAGELIIGFNDPDGPYPYAGSAPDIGALESGYIAPNRPPVLSPIGNKSAHEEELLEFIISASDPDNDPLTYSASNLPAGASFTPATRTFSWTPTSDQAGSYPNIHFQVSDGELTDSEDITITVTSGNRAPVLSPIGDKSVHEEGLLEFTISASDPDNDPLTYSASNLPAGATFNTSTHTFSWTPTSDQAGSYPNVYFQVSDGELADSENITITVTAGSSPGLRVNAGGSVYTDSHGNSWQADQAYSSGNWGFYGADNTVDHGTSYAISGTTDDRIYQTERWGLSGYRFDLGNGTYNINLHFAETYEGITGPGQRVFDVSVEGQLALDNLDIFSEVGHSTALIKVLNNVTVQDGQLNIDFSSVIEEPEINGIEIFAAGATPNNPPVLNPIGDKSVEEGALLEFTISATDPDGDTLAYSASNLPTGASFTPANHTFSWTPDSGQAGSYPNVHFQVYDGELTDAENISITVNTPSTSGGGGGGGGGPDTSPPRITDITVNNITKTSADISWTTHEKSDSQVEYQASPALLSTLDETMVREHSVHLSNLIPGTTYQYKVMSRDVSGNLAVSDEYTLTTPGTPPTLTVSALDISPTNAYIGEDVLVSVLVSNSGDAAGNYQVVLKINDTVVATKDVTDLPGGATQEVVFNTARNAAGFYTVEVNGVTGSFTVTGAPATEAILFNATPTYNSETGQFARARITYEVESPAEPMTDVGLILKVGLDGEPIEELPLFAANQLEMGRSGSLDYIPPQGWQSGTYTFQAMLYADGELYASTAAAELEVSADTAVTVVRWATLSAIIGITLVVIAVTVVMILRRRRDMLGA